MLKAKEDTNKIEYNGREVMVGEFVGNHAENGIFQVMEIQRVFVEETDVDEIFKGFKIGQELTPEVVLNKMYKGSSFEALKKPKACVVGINLLKSAEAVLDARKREVDDVLENIREVRNMIE